MTGDQQIPLTSAAKQYAQAALAAREDAATTWITDAAGNRIAAITPCDVALRGDWRKIAEPKDGDGRDALPGSQPDIVPVPGYQLCETHLREYQQDMAQYGPRASGSYGIMQAMPHAWAGQHVHGDHSGCFPGCPCYPHCRIAVPAREPRYLHEFRSDSRTGNRVYDQHGRVFEDGDVITVRGPGWMYRGAQLEQGSRWRMTWAPQDGGWRLDEVTGDNA